MKMTSITEVVAVTEQQQDWDRLFREIKMTSAQYNLSCKAAKMQENRNRNRYRDVSPFDHSRVLLNEGPSDYINSSLVQVESADRKYILSQGPLPGTSGHLWQMVWEQNSRAIIMLNKVIEKGTRKCHQYWPLDENHPMGFDEDDYQVTLKSEVDNRNFIIRKLELTKLSLKESRTIIQFHYIAWPDFGVPESPTAFLDFLACVREHGVLESDVGPAVIHCSAGIGRSGTFALVDTCLVFLEKGIPFDIRETLLEMRKYRMGLIQTPQQLRFSYFAIAECERIQQHKQDEESVSSGASETDEDEPPESNGDYGNPEEGNDDSPPDEHENEDEARENRKRHGEPNVHNDEKRGKQEEVDVPIETVSENLTDCRVTQEDISSTDNNNTKDGLRQRQISERKTALKNNIEQIKNNMRESEKKRRPWKSYIIGGIIATVVIGLAVKFWYR